MDTKVDDEMQTRICLARQIRKEIEPTKLSCYYGIYRVGFWTILKMLDIAQLLDLLHKLQTLPKKKERRALLNILDCLPNTFPQLIRLFNGYLLKSQVTWRFGVILNLQLNKQSLLIVPSQARDRDGNLCIATGAFDPVICHIVAPIIWPPGLSGLIISIQVSGLFGWGEDFYTKLRAKLLHKEEGNGSITTLMTNMICLGRRLEPSWSEGLFALEPIEPLDDDSSSMATMRLRVHWLRRTRFTCMASRIGKSFSADPRDVFVKEDHQLSPDQRWVRYRNFGR
ncbi:hypothetical protein BDP81DRAFT_494718 [Colletotrichum phormii]|uniref:Uncharacterized protein n=1 Tax=Colletotrichum phormii TaxID=359342 RepID=A0AAJ0EBC5_9PEZI|nr:uncharacterized protein BDP81DRAFT_494718 [Colletotrichum phormii]KAK1633472.1 hypothetical protein BDP81DRAFT_494718 [Colletotrichum phormii]